MEWVENERVLGVRQAQKNKLSVRLWGKIEETGLLPVEYLVSIYQDKEMPVRMRLEAAKAAAPYVHAKLSNVELSQPAEDRPVEDMSDEELAAAILEIRKLREDFISKLPVIAADTLADGE